MNIPLDIILCVFDHLETQDVIALSLACKGLYCHLFGDARTRFEHTSNDGRLKIQTMLEKDLPHNQVYCAFCGTFHSVDKRYRKKHCQEHRFPNLNCFATHTPGSEIWKLKYLDARSMMNATLFQKPVAKKLQRSLERIYWHWPDGKWDPWEQSWEPKVIDEELFLMVTSSYKTKKVAGKKEEFTYGVCKHLAIHAKFPHIWADMLSLSRSCCSPKGDYASGTCRICYSDFTLKINWGSGRRAKGSSTGWAVRISSWHRLGSLRSPNDPVWARCAGRYETLETRRLDGPDLLWDGPHPGRGNGFWTGPGAVDDRVWEHITYHDGWERQVERSRPGAQDAHYGLARDAWRQADQSGS